MGSTRRILLTGIKSGMIAGVVGAILFGIYVEIALLVESNHIAVLYFIIPIFLIGIPLGLLEGAIVGLLISYTFLKNGGAVQSIRVRSVLLGCFAGSIYPLSLILLSGLLQKSISQEELLEGVFGLAGGVLCGGIAGLFGSKVFVRSLKGL
jgi:hypothetical protein